MRQPLVTAAHVHGKAIAPASASSYVYGPLICQY